MENQNSQAQEIQKLFQKSKQCLPELKKLFAEISTHWGYEDAIYFSRSLHVGDDLQIY